MMAVLAHANRSKTDENSGAERKIAGDCIARGQTYGDTSEATTKVGRWRAPSEQDVPTPRLAEIYSGGTLLRYIVESLYPPV